MTTTQSMQRFDDALDKLRSGDADFFNKLYWANTCDKCGREKAMNCGRGHEILSTMDRLTYSQPVPTEVE
jgi:hypothetical protein